MDFSRLNTLCTPLVWMRIAAIVTLYTTSGYIINCCVQNFVLGSKCRKCSVQNCVHCTSGIYCLVQNFVHCTLYISRCRVQSRYCRNSHPDQWCTKRVQPGIMLECMLLTYSEYLGFDYIFCQVFFVC